MAEILEDLGFVSKKGGNDGEWRGQYLLHIRGLNMGVGAEEDGGKGRERRVSMPEETFVKKVVVLTTSSVTMSWALGGVFHMLSNEIGPSFSPILQTRRVKAAESRDVEITQMVSGAGRIRTSTGVRAQGPGLTQPPAVRLRQAP